MTFYYIFSRFCPYTSTLSFFYSREGDPFTPKMLTHSAKHSAEFVNNLHGYTGVYPSFRSIRFTVTEEFMHVSVRSDSQLHKILSKFPFDQILPETFNCSSTLEMSLRNFPVQNNHLETNSLLFNIFCA